MNLPSHSNINNTQHVSFNHPYPQISTTYHPISNLPISNHHLISNNPHPISNNHPTQTQFTVRPTRTTYNNITNLPHPIIINNPTKQINNKSISQIVYKTQPSPTYFPNVPFHQSQIRQPIVISTTQPNFHKPNPISKINPINQINPINPINQPHSVYQIPTQTTAPIIRPNVLMTRTLQDFRRNVTPINTPPKHSNSPNSIIHPIVNINKDKDIQKYDSLRWQNKYEDLKAKYFQLLKIVQNNSHVQDSWLLQQQNKLLRQKVKLLQQKDHKYYNQVSKRIQKMIDFHKQTTTQQCSLLIDRYRLENKFLQKI